MPGSPRSPRPRWWWARATWPLLAGWAACAGPVPSRTPLGIGALTDELRTDRLARSGWADGGSGAKEAPPERLAASDDEREHDDGEKSPVEDAPDGGSTVATGARGGSSGDARRAAAAPVDAAAFVGDFRGEDVSTYRLTGLPDRTERDPKARVTVKSSGATELTFVLVDSSNGNDICALDATLANGVATITPGQPCFEQSGESSSATASVTKGTAKLEGERLVLDADLDVEMAFGDQSWSGTMAYHFDGKR